MTERAKPNESGRPEWAVVTGATGTLGRPVVAAMLEHGLKVLAVARGASTWEFAGSLSDVVPLDGDVTSDDVEAQIDAHLTGPVRAIVHLAGAPLGGAVGDVATDAMTASFEVKVNGLLRVVRGADRYLGERSRIIAVTGNLGYDPLPGAATAGVSNAALANLVRQLNRALGPRGVTCHAIAPGPVESPRLERLISDVAQAQGWNTDAARQSLLDSASVDRFATPEDVVWAVMLLLEDAATVTAGSTLFLDGGRRTAIP